MTTFQYTNHEAVFLGLVSRAFSQSLAESRESMAVPSSSRRSHPAQLGAERMRTSKAVTQHDLDEIEKFKTYLRDKQLMHSLRHAIEYREYTKITDEHMRSLWRANHRK